MNWRFHVLNWLLDKTIWKQGPGVIDPNADLAQWRTGIRILTYYKTFCRFSCYEQLTTKDVTFFEDHVSVEFRKAKNDQMYNGSFSLLSKLPCSPYCPYLIFASFFEVMSFSGVNLDYLNCRILKSGGLTFI